MEIIKANSEFNLEDMHSSLMLYGYYCYHDSRLEGIVPEDLHFDYVPSLTDKKHIVINMVMQ